MNFNTLEFLLFLPVVVALHWALPHRLRWALLLAASLLFYFWWEPLAGLLLAAVVAVTWLCGLGAAQGKRPAVRKACLAGALGTCLGCLGVFKYAGFFARLAGASPGWRLLLPAGISFYTFQALSYVLDVYRGRTAPEGHFGYYALFISFFPQLVAGPIERSERLLPQLRRERRLDREGLAAGGWLLLAGYFKKVVLADGLAPLVDGVYAVPAALLAWGFLLPAQYGDTFMGELKHKVRYLEEAPSPRIILVGGSGVAFGVDSALMERELPGYTVVNFGMYAALGTTVMLDLSQDLVREGDIVILIPEQQEQTLSGFFDPAVMWQGADGAWELLRALPKEYLGRMAGQFPYFAADKCAAVLRGRPPQGTGVYRRDAFNAAGDVASPLCERNVMEGGYDPNTPIRFDGELLSEEFAGRARAYAQAARDKGAAVWYAFCPMNALAVEGTEGPDGFFDAVQSALGVPVVGDPNDSVLDAGWFYDTNFHLNASGKTVYTRLLVRGVKAMLGDSNPTDIPLPAMPELGQAGAWAGDDSDAPCFTFEDRGGWAAVVGLTPEGAGRERLTVPSTWNGLPVAAIGEAAFAGGGRLEEVVLQQNIHAIADGAFAGCPGLERIVLLGARPSDCRVGQGLLNGTDATVYVPPEALSRYRADYFWSVHASRVLPEGG